MSAGDKPYKLRDASKIKAPTPAGERPNCATTTAVRSLGHSAVSASSAFIASSASADSSAPSGLRPKATPYKPGQPDRNLDPNLPRTVRLQSQIYESSEEEVVPAPGLGQLIANIKAAANVANKSSPAAGRSGAGTSKVAAKGKERAEDGAPAVSSSDGRGSPNYFDPTDDDDEATPPPAQRPTKLHIDLTADSQEVEPTKSASSHALTNPAPKPIPASKSAAKGPVAKSPIKSSAGSSPTKAPSAANKPAAKKSWAAAHEAATKAAVAESKSGSSEAASSSHNASSAYLYFKEPVIASHPQNSSKGEGIGLWCSGCCAESQLVWRPFNDSSTSNLRSHINSKASLANRIQLSKQGKTGPMDAYTVKGTVSASKEAHVTAEEARQIAAEWVTGATRPLCIVEDTAFRKLLSPAVRNMMPSRKVVSDDIVRLYHAMLQVNRDRLAAVRGCFHLALDVWTSRSGDAFLPVFVNYQEEGTAVRFVLNTIPFLASHDAKNMSRAIFDTIEMAGITNRVWNIVADNASENGAMLPMLSALGAGRMNRFRGKASQVRCMAHVCNLVSKAVANTYIKAAETLRKQAAEDIAADDDGQGGDDEDAQSDTTDKEESAEETDDEEHEEQEQNGDDTDTAPKADGTKKIVPASDDEYEEVLDEPDLAISSALNPGLVADQQDDEELDLILRGPRLPPQDLVTPSSSASTISAASAAIMTPAQAEEHLLQNAEVGQQIKKLAWLAKKLHSAPTARRYFKRECKRHGIPKPWTLSRDVATRWDSTQHMIERAVKLWKAIISFTEGHPEIVNDKFRLHRADKVTFDNLLSLLNPMVKATLNFSKKTNPMIGEVVGMFERLDSQFGAIENEKKMPNAWHKGAERARLVVSKYYGLSEQTEVYSLATLLHPNYRLEFLEAMKWKSEWKEAAVDVLRSHYEQFYKLEPQASQDTSSSEAEDEDEEIDLVTLAMMKRSSARKSTAKVIDPIDEWLSATSVDVERLFSRAGRNATPMRNSMLARKLAKVVCVGQWFRDDLVPTSLLKTTLDQERQEQEQEQQRELKKLKRKRDSEPNATRKKKKVQQNKKEG
ncbi:hypothetical protein V8E36_004948 [Tilletia maclaganii]